MAASQWLPGHEGAGLMLTQDELGALARMLQDITPLCLLSDMQVRSALELLQQRGYLRKPADA